MSSVLFIKLKIFNIEKFYFSTLKTKLSVSCIVKNCVVKTKRFFYASLNDQNYIYSVLIHVFKEKY